MQQHHVGPGLRQLVVDEGGHLKERDGGWVRDRGAGHSAHARSQAARPWRSTSVNPRLGPSFGALWPNQPAVTSRSW